MGKENRSEEVAELFMEGRSKATVRQYCGAYRKWTKFLKNHYSGVTMADERSVCGYLVEMEKRGVGEGAVNQFLAMIGFLSELQGAEFSTNN